MRRKIQHNEKLNFEKVQFITFISFLLGFSSALLSYIISSYFKLVLHTDNVGIFFFLSYILVLVILLNFHKLIGSFGKVATFYGIFITKTISILFLTFLPPSYFSLIFLVVYIITEAAGWVNLDVILEAFSTDKMSGRIRGLYLTITNTGFILGPFLATRILDQFDYKGLFFIVFVVNFLVFSIALMGLRGLNHDYKRKSTIVAVYKRIKKRKNILRIYYISFLLEFFYALMIIYTPLYLLNLGFDWGEIGIAFSIMLIPFVIVQYPAGMIADKKMGEKELLVFSIFIMGVSTFAFYLTSSSNIFVWAGILFMTRVGAALVEILRDSYFYKRIDSGDIDIIDFFRTSKPVAYILATGIASIFLFFLPMTAIFLFLSLVIFSGLYPAFALVDNHSEKEARKRKYNKAKQNRY
jgi:MFS family permease